MTETMGVAIGIGVLALVFIYLGCLIWKKEKITLLHSYHYDKVSPSDKKVFCKISGWGVIFIGIGLLATAIIIGITDSAGNGKHKSSNRKRRNTSIISTNRKRIHHTAI